MYHSDRIYNWMIKNINKPHCSCFFNRARWVRYTASPLRGFAASRLGRSHRFRSSLRVRKWVKRTFCYVLFPRTTFILVECRSCMCVSKRGTALNVETCVSRSTQVHGHKVYLVNKATRVNRRYPNTQAGLPGTTLQGFSGPCLRVSLYADHLDRYLCFRL